MPEYLIYFYKFFSCFLLPIIISMFSSRFHQLRYYSGKNLTFLISYPQPNNLHFRNHQMIVHKEKAFNDPEKSHFIHVNPVAVPSVDFASINRIGVRQVFCMSVWYRISLQPARVLHPFWSRNSALEQRV